MTGKAAGSFSQGCSYLHDTSCSSSPICWVTRTVPHLHPVGRQQPTAVVANACCAPLMLPKWLREKLICFRSVKFPSGEGSCVLWWSARQCQPVLRLLWVAPSCWKTLSTSFSKHSVPSSVSSSHALQSCVTTASLAINPTPSATGNSLKMSNSLVARVCCGFLFVCFPLLTV